ncbi:MAG: RHS repeat domain-containing protein [Phycisphaerales bacterium JB063]
MLEVRKNGDTDPYEQFVYDGTYIDAPFMRYVDHNQDGDLLDADEGEHYFFRDASYNLVAYAGADGTIKERYRYTPYGKRIAMTPAFVDKAFTDHDQQRGFQGLRHDEESGLIENRARMLDPSTGRFLQRDPLGYPDGMNSYAAYHVTLDSVDPYGLAQIPRINISGDLPGGRIWFQILSSGEVNRDGKTCVDITVRLGGRIKFTDLLKGLPIPGAAIAATGIDKMLGWVDYIAEFQVYGGASFSLCSRESCDDYCLDECSILVGARLIVGPEAEGRGRDWVVVSAWGGIEGEWDMCTGSITLTLKASFSIQVRTRLKNWGVAWSTDEIELLSTSNGPAPLRRWSCN